MNEDSALSILVLEDQGLVRAGMRALIQICEPRASIGEAASYEEAVARLQNEAFDIVFLDIDLKDGRSGIDVLKHIRAAEISCRAVMLSCHSERDIVMECIAAGASGFIVKDMEEDGVFRRALDTIFRGSIFLPPKILGRGGFSPAATPPSTTVESLGLRGRTVEALYYLCQGLPNKTIAKVMNVEEGTIRKDYVPKLFRAFNVVRRTDLIIEVARRGVIVPSPKSAF